MNNKSIAKALAFLFLFAFSTEVLSGVTLEQQGNFDQSGISEKISNGFWFDFVFEELNESEEEHQEGKTEFLFHESLSPKCSLKFLDFTKSFRQYHLDLYRSSALIPLFAKYSVRLI